MSDKKEITFYNFMSKNLFFFYFIYFYFLLIFYLVNRNVFRVLFK